MGCDSTSSTDNSVPFEEITMEWLNSGGSFELRVDTQAEYDSLIYHRFQKPLDDYWNRNYETTLLRLKDTYPGLTDAEYEILVRNVFYSTFPFKGTENATHPIIDFNRYTLLGQSAHSGGCKQPVYTTELTRKRHDYTFFVTVGMKGTCDMAISHNVWILTKKIPASSNVIFDGIAILIEGN